MKGGQLRYLQLSALLFLQKLLTEEVDNINCLQLGEDTLTVSLPAVSRLNRLLSGTSRVATVIHWSGFSLLEMLTHSPSNTSGGGRASDWTSGRQFTMPSLP